jgi:Uma2 family endonuclease
MIATHVPTVEDFIRAHGDRAEFVHGAIVEKPMPNGPHSDCQAGITTELRLYGRKTGLGKARPEWHHRFGPPDDVRLYVPDVAFVFTQDKQDLPEYANRASELMIEIQSPSTDLADLLDKLHFYLANGAKSVWVVYPAQRRVDVFKPGAPTKTFVQDAVLIISISSTM